MAGVSGFQTGDPGRPLSFNGGSFPERFLYTPPIRPAPGVLFTGNDRFIYAVQDTGGLISKAAAVTVAVEGLQMQAQFQGKIGKWRISGASTNPVVPDPLSPGQNTPNTIAIFPPVRMGFRCQASRHSGMHLAGSQPHGNPATALAWIPAKSMPE